MRSRCWSRMGMAELRRFRCDVCGYVHEGPEPPEICPVCGVGREMFSPVEVPQASIESPAAGGTRWVCTVCGYEHAGDAPPELCPVCAVDAELFVLQPPTTESSAIQLTSERIVIVGAGGAGLTAAEYARKQSSARISLINKEPVRPYNRLSLTRFLNREVVEAELFLKTESWYAEQSIEIISGEVTRIDRSQHLIELGDGTTQRYDRLVLANGAHPFVPPIVGVQREGVLPLRTLAQAQRILQVVKPGTEVVVIGGGLLGLEAAAALNSHGARVTVVEGHGWLLPRQLAQSAGELLTAHLEGIGVAIARQAVVAEIYGDETVHGVRLQDRTELPARLVILAAGVRPNKYLPLQAGLETHRGVIVDDAMRTSDPDVFACGDVAEHRGVVYGLWTTALGQGAVAGANAAGGASSFGGTPPANQLKVLDLPVFSIGQFNPVDGGYVVLEHCEGGHLRRFVCHDGAIAGANLVGDLHLAGPIKRAIELGTQLSELPAELRALPEFRE